MVEFGVIVVFFVEVEVLRKNIVDFLNWYFVYDLLFEFGKVCLIIIYF